MYSKRNFAANSKIWSGNFNSHFSEILTKVREFGFDGVEIPVEAAEIERTRLIMSLSEEDAAERKLVPIITASGTSSADPSSEDVEIRRRGVKHIKDSIDLCVDLGGSLVCGPLYTVVGVLRYMSEAERRQKFVCISDSLQQASEYAKARDVKIAIEPLCRYDTEIINTVAQSMDLINMIGSENLGLLLDTFQMNIEEKSIYGAIIAAGSKLFHFHACENDRGTPGTGSVPWNAVAQALAEVKYAGWISIESFTPFEKDFSSRMRVWRSLAPSQDHIAKEGLAFLKNLFS